jgi:hypothetical protein
MGFCALFLVDTSACFQAFDTTGEREVPDCLPLALKAAACHQSKFLLSLLLGIAVLLSMASGEELLHVLST